jgi:hypothetical protein
MRHKRWVLLQSREANVEELRLVHGGAVVKDVLAQSSLGDGECNGLSKSQSW